VIIDDEWTFHGGIADGQIFQIKGLDVWQHKWRPTGETIRKATPLYPNDPYKFSVYELRLDAMTVRLAATELSNGIWGFLLPVGLHGGTRQ